MKVTGSINWHLGNGTKIIRVTSHATFTGNLDGKIAQTVAYLKAEGATQISGVGFCW